MHRISLLLEHLGARGASLVGWMLAALTGVGGSRRIVRRQS